MLEIKLILCPVDFTEFSVRAYRYALSLAQHYLAKLLALHTVELWRYPSLGLVPAGKAYGDWPSATPKDEQELQELLRSNTLGVGPPPQLVVEPGNAAGRKAYTSKERSFRIRSPLRCGISHLPFTCGTSAN